MSPLARTLDPAIYKRISWIANCGAVSGFDVITMDDWRTNDFKVFMEVDRVIYWFEQAGSWWWKSRELTPHSCYYLGKFGWYWDYDIGEGLPPTSPRIGNIHPWPYAPALKTGEYLPLNVYTKEDIVFFHGENALKNVEKQQAFIAARKARRDACLTANYPRKTTTTQKTVPTDQQPMDWPGTPTEQMTPPPPEAAPTPPEQAGPGATIAKLTITFGETSPLRGDGLQLSLYL